MLQVGVITLCSMIMTACLCPFVLLLTRKLKASQPILGYVTNHYSKSGTPTMGGIAFLVGACSIVVLASITRSSIALACAGATLLFGALGFCDDFLKIRGRKNKGLGVFQKLVGQCIIGFLVACYAYFNPNVGSIVKLPAGGSFDLGIYALPIYVLFVVAVTNFVNLTDGLDGLVSTTGSVYLITMGIVLTLSYVTNRAETLRDLSGFSFALGGGLAVFYVLNSYPAKIFMGDTGSLGVGAGIACVSLFSGNILLFLVLGAVYCVSGISVILQVFYYKLTKKRIFKMAPFHHHLERCGIHENKIVATYSLVTLCLGIAVISFWG